MSIKHKLSISQSYKILSLNLLHMWLLALPLSSILHVCSWFSWCGISLLPHWFGESKDLWSILWQTSWMALVLHYGIPHSVPIALSLCSFDWVSVGVLSLYSAWYDLFHHGIPIGSFGKLSCIQYSSFCSHLPFHMCMESIRYCYTGHQTRGYFWKFEHE